MKLFDLLDENELAAAIDAGYVRHRDHPTEPLGLFNYSERCAYDGAWNDTTRACRGLIYRTYDYEVVARPYPKFFNYGEPNAPEVSLSAHVRVSDKVDGSLGILYPVMGTARAGVGTLTPGTWAIATRGSFVSDQALRANEMLFRYLQDGWCPANPRWTYVFEIVYPENRIVVDYGHFSDLILLDVLDTETGRPVHPMAEIPPWAVWRGPRVPEFPTLRTLGEALAMPPREKAEGLVIYVPDADVRLKVKQDDYVRLHRILTHTNARDVWEVAAVRACRHLIAEPKHWATYLGIDPARAVEVLGLADDWLEAAGIPDEFYAWVRATYETAEEAAGQAVVAGLRTAEQAAMIADRRKRYEYVAARSGDATTEVMRLACETDPEKSRRRLDELRLKGWRIACPPPTAPFARGEDVA